MEEVISILDIFKVLFGDTKEETIKKLESQTEAQENGAGHIAGHVVIHIVVIVEVILLNFRYAKFSGKF